MMAAIPPVEHSISNKPVQDRSSKNGKKCQVCDIAILGNNHYSLDWAGPPTFVLCSNKCLFEFVVIEELVGDEKTPEELKSQIDKLEEELS